MKRTITSIFAAAAIALLSGTAMADGIIQFGDTYLGVNDEGHLNVSNGGTLPGGPGFVGLSFETDFGSGSDTIRDATSPGCLCEGWGVAANGSSMYANAAFGISNVTNISFASDATTATSVVSMTSMPGLEVSHAYAPSAAANVFEAVVTITNNTGAAATDVRYTRAMDWDVPPTEFAEFVTIGGTGTTTDLLYAGDNGFATGNPLTPGERVDLAGCGDGLTDFADCGAADHGALFDFGFGDLADGESITFSIFYGAADSEAGALAALGTIGAELFSFGQSSTELGPSAGTPATFIFAFSGVGGTPVIPPTGVPEPSTLMLFGMGLLGLGLARRRRSV